ncbi:aldehyde dehydrogenase family protein [Pseudomonas carnis]|jgi:aldehyde dehydrogenase (NAD+)|uniref:Aldehyde dehydrogenase family protein n=1 Tax=Pseudomonas carnis TaxID=2487355 RepID=A0ABT5RLY9_9PSED|nr:MULTISPECIES: aldehyde dehydrogenase family protein [Pseudomonas]MDD1947017.1 aldehyde dehydrogenase family protein [Pseudomonas carnis]USW93754.1 aldehyde dehydrogenase family protein [Pseudomonas proteolytica]USX02301.1 aldehyde dehydrogenase family protein [Pseudomonas proteolytica]
MSTLYIDGRKVPATGGQSIPVYSPVTGEVYAEIARGMPEDIDLAVKAARSAVNGDWGRMSATERGRILVRIGNGVLANIEELAEIEAKDTGKPIALARKDIEALARYFEFYGGAADKVHGEVIPYLSGYTVSVVREACGVVGHIIPWNYPAQMLGRTIAPALAMGNASIVKPAEDACMTSLRFAEIAAEAGLPAGALNIVTGYGREAGAALAGHPGINLITFTGSPDVGVAIQTAAAVNHVKCVLELGGKCPQVVFADADLDKAVPVIVGAIIQNAGQTCSAGSRVLIQKEVYEDVITRVAAKFREVRVGLPETSPDCGPIITKAQFGRVNQFIQECKDSDLPVIAEGAMDNDLPKGGYYVRPTLFGPVPRDHKLAREEVFGPVLAALSFDDEDDAVALANGTDYGLVASIWSENGARQQRMAKRLEGGQVFINCYGAGGGVELPFGGIRKSGHGREKGLLALDEFSITKTVVSHHG